MSLAYNNSTNNNNNHNINNRIGNVGVRQMVTRKTAAAAANAVAASTTTTTHNGIGPAAKIGDGVAAAGQHLLRSKTQRTTQPQPLGGLGMKPPVNAGRAVVGGGLRQQPAVADRQKPPKVYDEEEDIEVIDDDDETDSAATKRETATTDAMDVDDYGQQQAAASSSSSKLAAQHPSDEQKMLFVKAKTRFCERPTNVPDIYEDDHTNEQMMTAYVHHIFDYLHDIEPKFTLPPKWLENSDIQPRMRAILVDWLISLHLKFRMQVDTLYLAIDLLDRFLACRDVKVTKDELQLVGVTCLFTASKFEEIYPPDVADYVYMADGACTKADVIAMEMVVLHKLQFSLHAPLSCKFLRRYAKAADSDTKEYGIAKYVLEMTLLAPDMTCYKASFKAAAAQFTSMLLLDYYRMLHHDSEGGDGDNEESNRLTSSTLKDLWTTTMTFYSTYKIDELLLLVKKYLAMLDSTHTNKYTALRKKYGQDNFCKISSLDELQPKHAARLAAAIEVYIEHATKSTSAVGPAVSTTAIADEVLDMSTNDDMMFKSVEPEEKSVHQQAKKPQMTSMKQLQFGGGKAGVAVKGSLVARAANRAAVAVKR